MIYVDRNSVAPPADLQLRSALALEKLRQFFDEDARKRGQKTPKFDSSLWTSPGIRAALHNLFRGKCAICESRLGPGEEFVEHLRPKLRATQLNGQVDPAHYWWLSYEWSNLYAICRECGRHRGNRFPVTGPRAPFGATGSTLRSESALLLDPCDDDPEPSLDFREDGTVHGRDIRGKTTIEVFGLNRSMLVEARGLRCAQVEAIGSAHLMGNDPGKWQLESFVRLMTEQAIEHGEPYVALTRQQSRRYFERAIGAAPVKRGRKSEHRPAKQPAAYRGAIWLERIEIENFKALRRLELQFPPPAPAALAADPAADAEVQSPSGEPDRSEPWLMLLGENGVGKSTVLKAIALALMPEAKRAALVRNPADWITRGVRARSGIIRLQFTVGADPVELHFSRDSNKVTVKGSFPRMPILGYGSTRLLPAPSKSKRPAAHRIRVGNLFSPRVPLSDATRWLASPDAIPAAEFNLLATSLKAILSLEEDDRIIRRRGALSARLFDDVVPIRELSDGYQSVLALVTDMMLNLSRATFDMSGVEGVVLVDEIEGHLHPRWKIRIVSALRRMFPRVRFIATTHDPLCVQGLQPGELHVMARHPETREIRADQVDVPPGMRADQILTGAWFDLPSTRDPETLALMREYNGLLLRIDRAPAEEAKRLELERSLQKRLDEFAGTSIEQLGMQAAAEVMREEPAADTAAERELLRDKILSRLRQKQAAPTA